MDKYELTIKTEQLDKLVRSRDYVSAAKVAEQIEWKKMKQWSVMSNAIDAFIATEKYDKARNVCIYAYNRKLGGRRLLATLMDMYVRLGEYEDAEEIYHEYVEMAPRDVTRYILLYKLKRAEGAPVTELIEILQDYKEKELDEEYEYELALLYSEAGMTDRCVRECDELVLWFADGVYVEKALRLKQMYTPLSQRQAEKLARLEKMSSMGINSSELIDGESEPKTAAVPVRKNPLPVREAAATVEKPEYFAKPEKKAEKEKYAVEPEAEPEEPAYTDEPEEEADFDYIEETETAAEEAAGAQAEYEEPQYNEAEYEKPDYTEPVDELNNTTEWSPIDINIKVPDYSVYDTRNVQQELKANVEEIMQAYKNREKTEALREAAELEDMPDDDSDPTKEIIINKHQWRKASRNAAKAQEEPKVPKKQPKAEPAKPSEQGKPVLSPDMTIRQAAEQMTIEQMAEIVAQLQAEQERRKKEAAQQDDQIDGQMDISQWLSDLDDEPDADYPDDMEEVQPTREIPVHEVAAALEEQQEVTEPENQPEKQPEIKVEEEYQSEDAEFEEIPDVDAAEEEEYQPAQAVEEHQPVKVAAVEESEPESESEDEAEYEPEESDDAHDMENTLDLEEAVSAGIERIIDDTVRSALGDGDAARYTLKDAERKFLDKYLYMSGMERRLCRYIGSYRAVQVGKAGNVGNIMIMGSRNTDKITFAVNLFKALHAFDKEREQKLARISADKLNEKSYEAYADKLAGQTLIVENAGRLKRAQIVSMMREGSANVTTFIIVDEEYEINKLFAENSDFAETFTGCFLLKQYTVNELVDIAKDYADEQGWRIEDKALLKLYLILSQLPNDDTGNVVGVVKETMERAAEHARSSFGNKLFGRFRSALVIKESDFREADADEDDEYDKDTYEDDDYDEDDN